MKKVVLVYLVEPDQIIFSSPLGLLALADSLRKNGFETVIFHEKVTKSNLEKLYALTKENTLFVGFSTITSPSLLFDLEASKHIKQQGNIIIWGGIHASLLPEICLKEDCVDYVLRGEAEETIIQYANAIKNNEPVLNIEGLCYKNGKEIIINKLPPLVTDIDKYGFAWDLVDVNRYFFSFGNYTNLLPIITSRGCPHRCGFCYNLKMNKRRWRAMTAKKVISYVNNLKNKYNIKGVIFADDNFFTDRKRAFEILSNINLPYTVGIRADYFNDAFMEKLIKTKCIHVGIGAESGSDRILKLIDKDITSAQIENAFRLLYKHKIPIAADFMSMFPGETEEEMKMTINLVSRAILKYNASINGPKIYNPYPGTSLYSYVKAKGWKEPTTTKGWASYFRYMDASELGYIPKEVAKKFMILHLIILIVLLFVKKTRSGTFSEKLFFNLFKPVELFERFRLKYMITFFPFEIYIANNFRKFLKKKDGENISLLRKIFHVNPSRK